MKVYRAARKRIWEVDCGTLDLALAGSFDWRAMANLVKNAGYELRTDLPESALNLGYQNLLHQLCHDRNSVSLSVEQLLNLWYADSITRLSSLPERKLSDYFLSLAYESNKELAGIFWALGSDSRELCCRRQICGCALDVLRYSNSNSFRYQLNAAEQTVSKSIKQRKKRGKETNHSEQQGSVQG